MRWFNKRLKTINELLHNLIATSLIFEALASYKALKFFIGAGGCLTDFIIDCLFNINLGISDTLPGARKHEFGHA